MKDMANSKRKARDYTFKVVFSYLFTGEKDQELLTEAAHDEELSQGDVMYIVDTVNRVIEHKQELMDMISKYAKGYTIDRVYKADLAVLLVAIAEMKYDDSIPDKVSINEAVNISKVYSTVNSSKFVNGILSSVYKELND